MSSPPPEPARPAPAPWGDVLFRRACEGAGGAVLAVVAALVGVLTYQAWPALARLGELQVLTSWDWDPNRGVYGALLFVYGTAATSAIAMLVAVPLGVGSAAYLSEIAGPRARRACGFLLELLAAIPSVIFGFWAVEFLAKRGLAPAYDLLGLRHQSGEGILAAGLVLAVMILPYITAVSYDVCQAVPRSQREGALALGATRWQTIWRVVLPYARPGVIAACFLGLGRAAGETMAVTMVVGNTQSADGLFRLTATGDSIPSLIAKQLHETGPANAELRAVLIALGLLLLALTVATNVTARLLIRWASRPRARAGWAVPPAADGVEAAPPAPPSAEQAAAARAKARRTDRLMTGVLGLCQLLTVVPLFLILGYITYQGAGEVTGAFFTNLPNDSPPGLAHALLGSVTLVALASAFAVPAGILAAVLLSEYRKHPLAGPVRFAAEQLGGVPSIVVGVFGYTVFLAAYPTVFGGGAWRFSAWAGAFALGVLMLPVVVRSAEEAMRLVPNSLREASYALGAGRRQTILRVVLPAALPAVVTGVLLAVGRVAGETAPLILTARGSQFFARSLGDPTPSLPFYVYDFAKKPDEALRRLAWAGAFVLVVAVLLLNVGTRLAAGKRVVAAARAD